MNIPRPQLHRVLEELHGLMQEKPGIAYYYPQQHEEATICRFEWYREWRGSRFGLHLGFFLKAGDEDLEEITVYLTTNEILHDHDASLPNVRSWFVGRLNQEVLEQLQEAARRSSVPPQDLYHIPFYLSAGPLSFLETAVRSGEDLLMPSSMSRDGTSVTGVLIGVRAHSSKSARRVALQKVGLMSALLTLSSGTHVDTAFPEWKQKRWKAPESIADLDAVEVSDLYPAFGRPPFQNDADSARRVEHILHLYGEALRRGALDDWRQALFAYQAGKGVQNKVPTLSIVAYVAALGNMAQARKVWCSGKVACSECGQLHRHLKIGDTQAIVDLVGDVLSLEGAKLGELSGILKAAYRGQRSAFVHGAQLRHGESYQGYGLPMSMPTEARHVQESYGLRSELLTLERVTRLVLLEVLSNTAGVALDRDVLRVDDLNPVSRPAFEGSVSLPARVATAPLHKGG